MRIVILTNADIGLYKFRKELVEELCKDHEVYIVLPDGEFIERNNPDREVIAKRKAEPLQPDFSSYINALLAKSDETIASLKRELAAKDDIIQAKDDRIADLEKLAEERLHRIAELRRVIDANNMKDFPFPMGTADAGDKDRMRV